MGMSNNMFSSLITRLELKDTVGELMWGDAPNREILYGYPLWVPYIQAGHPQGMPLQSPKIWVLEMRGQTPR